MFFFLFICWVVYLLILYIWDKLRFKHISPSKTVLITGAAQGLGKELAFLYASKGCKVIIWDISDHLFPNLLQEAADKNFFILTFKCDITSNEQIQTALKQTLSKVPSIDILINNAGFCSNYLFEDLPLDRLQRTININFIGHALVTKALSTICEQFIVIASIMSKSPSEKASDYTASKHALDACFKTFRLELKRKKSSKKVMIVYPIHIKTSMFEGFKTKIDWILRSLEVIDVANAIYRAACLGKEEVFLPFWAWVPAYVIELLPSSIRDRVYLFLAEGALDRVKSR